MPVDSTMLLIQPIGSSPASWSADGTRLCQAVAKIEGDIAAIGRYRGVEPRSNVSTTVETPPWLPSWAASCDRNPVAGRCRGG